MKTTSSIYWLFTTGLAIAATTAMTMANIEEDPRPFVDRPDGAGILLERRPSDLSSGTRFHLQFPSEMVSDDELDRDDALQAIDIWPETDLKMSWITPTRLSVVVEGLVRPDQNYRFRLRDGLTDLDGEPLAVEEWGLEIASDPIQLSQGWWDRRDAVTRRIPARPEMRVNANYPMRLSDAADHVWFQNRATRERYPAMVLIGGWPQFREGLPLIGDAPDDAETESSMLRFLPMEPLPVNAAYDLVIDELYDAYGGVGLPYPAVFPVGVARPMELEYVVGRNLGAQPPFVEVKFKEQLGVEELPEEALTITPEVPNLRIRKNDRNLIAEGDFEVPGVYTVVVSDQIMGASGYGLLEDQRWTARFHPKPPALYFPDRTVRMRPALGLNFAFYQVNTGDLSWRLAEVPLERLPEVVQRLEEWREPLRDENNQIVRTESGRYVATPTELFVEAMDLSVVTSGSVPGTSGDEAELRVLEWSGEEGMELNGPMLLEISGSDEAGQIVGNRALIWFGDYAITRKTMQEEWLFRVASMATGEPVAGATLTVLDRSLETVAETVTDEEGLARVTELQARNTGIAARVDVDGRISYLDISGSWPFPSGRSWGAADREVRSFVMTDRNLYRPGQTAYFKGWIRQYEDQTLTPITEKEVSWTITQGGRQQLVASGETTLDEFGAWHGEWEIPDSINLGGAVLRAAVDGQTLQTVARFRVEDFRNPLFSVICTSLQPEEPAVSVIEVDSSYFHGAANAGARVEWEVDWIVDFSELDEWGSSAWSDRFSEEATSISFGATDQGEAVLDANGRVVLTSKSPFDDPELRARSQVHWTVDVTSPEGQTITGGVSQTVVMHDVLLQLVETERGQTFEWNAEAAFAESPEAVRLQVFKVDTSLVREQLAPHVYRIRNFSVYNEVGEPVELTDSEFTLDAEEPGRYVVVIRPRPGEPGIQVSLSTHVAGEGPSDVPVDSDTTLRIVSSKDNANGATPWAVGETASFEMLTPVEGTAWVTVETGDILDSFTLPVTGNTMALEIPVRPEYEPNAFLTAYLLRPGGEDALAVERFGWTEFRAEAPDRQLQMEIELAKAQVEPREEIQGTLRVTAQGRPVEGADVLIYLVDDSILELGEWEEPDLYPDFFRNRAHRISTFPSLRGYVDGIDPQWLTTKGFVIGDGGMASAPPSVRFTREEFLPLILWSPSERTDSNGMVEFSTKAPDNLTRFRVVAVATTTANQFGMETGTVEIQQRLMIEPALSRFVREGDEVELRAVIRQSELDAAELSIRCIVEGNLELLGEETVTATARKGSPLVVRFRARAGEIGEGRVRFEATGPDGLADDVRVDLKVEPAVILQREAVAGNWEGPQFAAGDFAPSTWEEGAGEFDLVLSTRDYLPKLMGIPYLLDFPHGCLEQQTSRLMVVTELANLFDALPDAEIRRELTKPWVEAFLVELQRSQLLRGGIPYWSGGVVMDPYVTIQSAWAVRSAEAAGFEVPLRLAQGLNLVMDNILTGHVQANANLKAFALYLQSVSEEPDTELLQSVGRELYLHRDQLGSEGKAMLALALHQIDGPEEMQKQLVRELPTDFTQIRFNPATFGSATRAETLAIWARLKIDPDVEPTALLERMDRLMESSASLSTQENLWLLVAFNALQREADANAIGEPQPTPTAVAPDGTAAAWTGPMDQLSGLEVTGLGEESQGGFVLRGTFSLPERKTALEDEGLRIERVLNNLTAPERNGSADAPIRIGDSVLVSYRIYTGENQSFVALEDLIPAGLEMLNPNLASVAAFYSLPPDFSGPTARLSHSEFRDASAMLYFDDLPSGSWNYAVLARATAEGEFIWPATQISPMYDSRFFGRSASGTVVISGDHRE